MKRFTIAMLALVFVMGMPMIVFAMDHSAHGTEKAEEMKHKGHDMNMDHAKEKAHDMHKGHDMGDQKDDFVEIGKDAQDGIVATVKVKTYDEETLASMAKMGMDATHHVMVFFTDEKSGEEITAGKAAIKLKGKDSKRVMLMQMGTGFGGDVTLGDGMYTFIVATKLEDGKKRKFSIMFHNM
jgi:hypothetical protein